MTAIQPQQIVKKEFKLKKKIIVKFGSNDLKSRCYSTVLETITTNPTSTMMNPQSLL